MDNCEEQNLKSLCETDQLYRIIFTRSPDGLLIIDEDGKFIDFNESAHRQLGYTREEFSRLRIADIDATQAAEEIGRNIRNLVETGSAEFDVKHRTKTGEIRYVHVISQVMTLSGRRVFHAIWRDITEHKRADELLRESERRYRTLVETADDVILLADLNGRHLFRNSAYYTSLGYDEKTLLDLDGFSRVHPEDLPLVRRSLDELQKQGRSEVEYRVRHREGYWIHRLAKSVVIYDELRTPRSILAVIRDITKHKQAEEALRNSERLYRLLFEANPHPMWMYDFETLRFLSVNDAAVAHYGYSREEFLAMTIKDIRPAEDIAAVIAKNEKIEPGIFGAGTWKHRKKDGSIIYVEIMLNDIVNAGRRARVVLAHDITRRRETEEALEQSNAFIKNILDTVDEGFIIVDRDFRIISANKAYLGQVKLTADKALGKQCYEVSHHRTSPCYLEGEDCVVRRSFETGEPHKTIHTHNDDKGGASTVVEIKSYPIKDETGTVLFAIEVINNITDRLKLENQLSHSRKMEAVGHLAGGIAHDFNNILTAIMGYGSLMMMNMTGDTEQKHQLQQILDSAERAANLTQGLLAFSRKQVVSLKPVMVNKIIANVEKLLRRLIGEDVELNVRLSREDLTIRADSSQIEQILMNLATNARDAMPRGGALMISTESYVLDSEFVLAHGYGRPGRYALISVSDTGVGMDAKTRENIFEPFFTTKEEGKGTGLGLSIVYGNVKQHEGYILCYSEPGKGTTFKIFLPLVEKELSSGEIAAPASVVGGSETILVAEDDSAVRTLTRQMLEHYGYTVIEAIDGVDACAKYAANRERISLLILDVLMPKRNGKEVYDEVRRDRSDVKVIFLSGYTGDVLGRQGILEQAVNFISKPVSATDLLRKVRETLDS